MKRKRIRKIEKVVVAEIGKLNTPELKKLVGECRRLTTTNCSWVMYGLKDIVTELAKNQIRWLRTQKQLLKER